MRILATRSWGSWRRGVVGPESDVCAVDVDIVVADADEGPSSGFWLAMVVVCMSYSLVCVLPTNGIATGAELRHTYHFWSPLTEGKHSSTLSFLTRSMPSGRGNKRTCLAITPSSFKGAFAA